MAWLRPGPPPHRTALAMIGARAGQRVLVVGAGDGTLAAAVALVTGLNGQTFVTDQSPGARVRVEAAASAAGALVEFVTAADGLPVDRGTFDVVVVQLEPGGSTDLADCAPALRDGGRIVVIERAPAAGLLVALRRQTRPASNGVAIRDALTALGLRAARVLAEADGAVFVEAIRR